jgi:hypothetical protein
MTKHTLQLPETLSRNGNEYRLYKRGKRVLVYAEGQDNQDLGYEVFKIKIAKACEVNGHYYPNRERFPGNEDFGLWAWSFVGVNRLERAMSRFNMLEGVDSPSLTSSYGVIIQ